MARKPSGSGRKKLPMARIEDRSRRDVTFSKRRAGVFKKAAELSALCGVDIAVIVFSPSGKAYSYGSPDVQTITHRLMAGVGGNDVYHGVREAATLNGWLSKIEEELEAERHRREEIDETRRRGMEVENGGPWWQKEEYPTSVTVEEMMRLMESMRELKQRVVEQAEAEAAAAAMNILGGAAAMTNLGGSADFFGAGTSSAPPNVYGDAGGSGTHGPF